MGLIRLFTRLRNRQGPGPWSPPVWSNVGTFAGYDEDEDPESTPNVAHREPDLRHRAAPNAPTPGYLKARGDEAAERGREDEAEARYRAAASLGHKPAIDALASLLAEQGRLEEAAATGDMSAMKKFGDHLIDEGRLDEGREFLERAADMGDISAMYGLASIDPEVHHASQLGSQLREEKRDGDSTKGLGPSS